MKEEKKKSILSMIFGIIGVLLFVVPYIGIILSVLAIVYSGNYNKEKEAKGYSEAGKILGIVGTITNTFFIIIVSVFMLIGA